MVAGSKVTKAQKVQGKLEEDATGRPRRPGPQKLEEEGRIVQENMSRTCVGRTGPTRHFNRTREEAPERKKDREAFPGRLKVQS